MKSIVKIKTWVQYTLVAGLSIFSGSWLNAQEHKIVTSYNNETEITAPGSVTLKDGFYIPAGKTVRIYVGGISFKNCIPVFAGIPSVNQNYISIKTFKTPNVFTEADANATFSVCDVNQNIQYFDGLGRLLQIVSTQASPTFKDLVQPVAYDVFGRETTKYLPYSTTGISGSYRSEALNGGSGYANSAHKLFYGLTGQNFANIPNPYSKTVFEESPLNRVIEQGAPGEYWQPALARTNIAGRTVVTDYGTNSNEVKLWTLTTNGASSGIYPAKKLHKTTSKDENWTGGTDTAGRMDEYKDFEGRIVLKRSWKTNTESLSTYYVYDDFGNLRYVLPPAVNENGRSPISSGFTESDEVFNQFIYAYHYDGRNRLVEKKIPGKGWEYLVYNKQDMVILTQDGNQKDKEWSYSKYDVFGRISSSGIYKSTAGRINLQGVSDGQVAVWESRNPGEDYNNVSFPQTDIEQQQVNYYDDYGIPGLPDNQSDNYSKKLSTLLTASKTKVIGTPDHYLWTVNYYDEEARIVKTYKQHYLGGTVNATNYDVTEKSYNFAGELIASNRVHHAGNSSTTIANRYEYDHVGRKLATFEKINADQEVALSKMDYNEIGQLLKKSVHSTDGVNFLQNNLYTYNARGWLKKNEADLFSFELKYEDGTEAQFNGNIANQNWGPAGGATYPNAFTYKYDKLGRLTSGVSTGIVMSENITYDEMGNILSLGREGGISGTYNYTGNQLKQITGGLSTELYHYDANGNADYDGRNKATLTYNSLSLPATVSRSGLVMTYVYDAAGGKLKKISNGSTRDYIDGIEYDNGALDIIHTEEGLARKAGNSYSYEYNLTDHLGNVRLSFYRNPANNTLEVLGRTNYYPFGKAAVVNTGLNKYLYNGKELQDELGQLDYGARFYDPEIGRWNVVDPLAEDFDHASPYNYGMNNPIVMLDPDGMAVESFNGNDDKPAPIPKPIELKEVVIKSGPMKGWVANGTSIFGVAQYRLPQAVVAANRAEAIAFLGKWTPLGRAITAVTTLLNLTKNVVLAKYPLGTILPTPTLKKGDFTKLKNGQGWRRNKTGEIYKKSHTSHGNEGNTGEQWKVWPEGTNEKDMGSNSKQTGERTTLDQNGKVIGN